MGHPRQPEPVLLVVAVFSRHPEAIDATGRALESLHGPIVLRSIPYEFNQTDYYAPSMGSGLQKQLLAFANLVRADQLADIKRTANRLEDELADRRQWPEPRPVNIDPGILTLGKFQLATTKDQSHRVYIGDGIYAETTLRFEAGQFVPWPWTYADYRQPLVLDFLAHVRRYYQQRLGASKVRFGTPQ
jgi:hypothetical protein